MRKTIAAASTLVLLFTSSPAFAYILPDDARPLYSPRRFSQFVRGDFQLIPQPPAGYNILRKTVAEFDTTGRTELLRAEARNEQRNFNRHFLGWDREGDYRVLDLRVDFRRKAREMARGGDDLPPTLLRTGGDCHQRWGCFDRPTRRDIRDNNRYAVIRRDRNLMREIQESR